MKIQFKMKYIQLITIIAIVAILFSCASSERVITNDGKVYKVKGDSFYNDGEDVSNQLSALEKEKIKSILEKQIQAKEEAAEKQERIEESLEEWRKKEKELKEQQKALEDKIENREEAREQFFEIKEDLESVKTEYQQLKDKDELSPKEEAKWQKRLNKLEGKLKEAELKINN